MTTPDEAPELTSRQARARGLLALLAEEPIEALGFLLYAIAEDVATMRRIAEQEARRGRRA